MQYVPFASGRKMLFSKLITNVIKKKLIIFCLRCIAISQKYTHGFALSFERGGRGNIFFNGNANLNVKTTKTKKNNLPEKKTIT